jgi:putative flippase GtrA
VRFARAAAGTHGAVLPFVVAGTVGFLVDAGVLQLLIAVFAAAPLPARVLSFLCANLVTWRLNRRFAFTQSQQGTAREWLRYLAASWVGAAANYLAFAAAIVWLPSAGWVPSLGVAVGSLAGMVVNFVLYTRVVFRGRATGS